MHLKHRSEFTAKIFSIVFYTFIVNVHIFTSLKEKNNLEAIDFASQSAVCFELWRLGKCQWSVTGQDFHGFKTFDWLGFVHSFRPHLSNISFFLLLFLSFSLSLGCFYFGFSGLFVHFKILSFVRSLLSVQLKSTYVCKNEKRTNKHNMNVTAFWKKAHNISYTYSKTFTNCNNVRHQFIHVCMYMSKFFGFFLNPVKNLSSWIQALPSNNSIS